MYPSERQAPRDNFDKDDYYERLRALQTSYRETGDDVWTYPGRQFPASSSHYEPSASPSSTDIHISPLTLTSLSRNVYALNDLYNKATSRSAFVQQNIPLRSEDEENESRGNGTGNPRSLASRLVDLDRLPPDERISHPAPGRSFTGIEDNLASAPPASLPNKDGNALYDEEEQQPTRPLWESSIASFRRQLLREGLSGAIVRDETDVQSTSGPETNGLGPGITKPAVKPPAIESDTRRQEEVRNMTGDKSILRDDPNPSSTALENLVNKVSREMSAKNDDPTDSREDHDRARTVVELQTKPLDGHANTLHDASGTNAPRTEKKKSKVKRKKTDDKVQEISTQISVSSSKPVVKPSASRVTEQSIRNTPSKTSSISKAEKGGRARSPRVPPSTPPSRLKDMGLQVKKSPRPSAAFALSVKGKRKGSTKLGKRKTAEKAKRQPTGASSAVTASSPPSSSVSSSPASNEAQVRIQSDGKPVKSTADENSLPVANRQSRQNKETFGRSQRVDKQAAPIDPSIPSSIPNNNASADENTEKLLQNTDRNHGNHFSQGRPIETTHHPSEPTIQFPDNAAYLPTRFSDGPTTRDESRIRYLDNVAYIPANFTSNTTTHEPNRDQFNDERAQVDPRNMSYPATDRPIPYPEKSHIQPRNRLSGPDGGAMTGANYQPIASYATASDAWVRNDGTRMHPAYVPSEAMTDVPVWMSNFEGYRDADEPRAPRFHEPKAPQYRYGDARNTNTWASPMASFLPDKSQQPTASSADAARPVVKEDRSRGKPVDAVDLIGHSLASGWSPLDALFERQERQRAAAMLPMKEADGLEKASSEDVYDILHRRASRRVQSALGGSFDYVTARRNAEEIARLRKEIDEMQQRKSSGTDHGPTKKDSELDSTEKRQPGVRQNLENNPRGRDPYSVAAGLIAKDAAETSPPGHIARFYDLLNKDRIAQRVEAAIRRIETIQGSRKAEPSADPPHDFWDGDSNSITTMPKERPQPEVSKETLIIPRSSGISKGEDEPAISTETRKAQANVVKPRASSKPHVVPTKPSSSRDRTKATQSNPAERTAEKVPSDPIEPPSSRRRDPPSPLRPPNHFYTVRLAEGPVFLRRTTIRPPALQGLVTSIPVPSVGLREHEKHSFEDDAPVKASMTRSTSTSPPHVAKTIVPRNSVRHASTSTSPPRTGTTGTNTAPDRFPETVTRKKSEYDESVQTVPPVIDRGTITSPDLFTETRKVEFDVSVQTVPPVIDRATLTTPEWIPEAVATTRKVEFGESVPTCPALVDRGTLTNRTVSPAVQRTKVVRGPEKPKSRTTRTEFCEVSERREVERSPSDGGTKKRGKGGKGKWDSADALRWYVDSTRRALDEAISTVTNHNETESAIAEGVVYVREAMEEERRRGLERRSEEAERWSRELEDRERRSREELEATAAATARRKREEEMEAAEEASRMRRRREREEEEAAAAEKIRRRREEEDEILRKRREEEGQVERLRRVAEEERRRLAEETERAKRRIEEEREETRRLLQEEERRVAMVAQALAAEEEGRRQREKRAREIAEEEQARFRQQQVLEAEAAHLKRQRAAEEEADKSARRLSMEMSALEESYKRETKDMSERLRREAEEGERRKREAEEASKKLKALEEEMAEQRRQEAVEAGRRSRKVAEAELLRKIAQEEDDRRRLREQEEAERLLRTKEEEHRQSLREQEDIAREVKLKEEEDRLQKMKEEHERFVAEAGRKLQEEEARHKAAVAQAAEKLGEERRKAQQVEEELHRKLLEQELERIRSENEKLKEEEASRRHRQENATASTPVAPILPPVIASVPYTKPCVTYQSIAIQSEPERKAENQAALPEIVYPIQDERASTELPSLTTYSTNASEGEVLTDFFSEGELIDPLAFEKFFASATEESLDEGASIPSRGIARNGQNTTRKLHQPTARSIPAAISRAILQRSSVPHKTLPQTKTTARTVVRENSRFSNESHVHVGDEEDEEEGVTEEYSNFSSVGQVNSGISFGEMTAESLDAPKKLKSARRRDDGEGENGTGYASEGENESTSSYQVHVPEDGELVFLTKRNAPREAFSTRPDDRDEAIYSDQNQNQSSEVVLENTPTVRVIQVKPVDLGVDDEKNSCDD